MLRRYLKHAIRKLFKQKTYSLINLSGLSIAIASCILTYLYVRNEYNVNRFVPDCSRIFRIESIWHQKNMGVPDATLAPVGPTVASVYPEVQAQVRLYLISAIVHTVQKNFKESVIVADSSFLSVFDLPLVAGNSKKALEHPRSVIITDTLAYKMYGSTNVVGKTMRFDVWGGGEREYVVTAVHKTIAWNSVTNFGGEDYDLIVPFNSHEDFASMKGLNSWDSRFMLTYVKLVPGASDKEVQKKLDSFINTFAPAQYRSQIQLKLEPLTNIYLDDNNGSARSVCTILTLVAVLMLLIACINFINLTMAHLMPRSKEVAMKSILGASRSQLVIQLMAESLIVSIGAAILALSISEIGLLKFLQIFGRPLVLTHYWDFRTMLFIAMVTAVAGIFAGCYPAILLTSFTPINAVKGFFLFRKLAVRFRAVLIIVQFSIAIILFVFVSVIALQVSFLIDKDLGFDQNKVLVIDSVPREWNSAGLARMALVEARLREIVGVISVSLSFDTPTYDVANSIALRRQTSSSQQAMSIPVYTVDESFADTYGITLKQGRFFSPDHPTDSSAIILNETAASRLGLNDPVGVALAGQLAGYGDKLVRVIGVVKDFNFESLHTTIRPLAFVWVRKGNIYRDISIKLSNANPSMLIGQIQRTWQKMLPNAPFVYFFVDQHIDRFYKGDRQLRDVLGLAAGLALLIACMGMYGLVFLNVAQRVKEIGIRKVLGASIQDIAILFARDAVKWVLIANVLAWPVAYYVIYRWLSDFAYRTAVSPWIFILSGAFALIVALVTISSHAIRAAMANPIESLRYE